MQMDNKEKVILKLANERKEEKPSGISVQRNFLEYAMKVVPTLESVKLTAPGIKLYESETTELTNELLGGLLFAINQFLSSTVFENIESGWAFLDVDTLLDGLKALNFYAVVSNNCQHIPEACDRIMQHLKTRVDSSLLESKVAELVSEGVTAIKESAECFTVYHNVFDERIPMIDPNGFAWLFTSREYADTIIERNKGISLSVKMIPKTEMDNYLRSWYALGIENIRLNVGTGDHEVELSVSDYFAEKSPKYQSVFLNYLLLRTKQTESIETLKKVHLTIWSAACREMTNSLYLVPVKYDDDTDEPIEDNFIHTSQRAAERMMKLQIEKQIGTSLEEYMVNDKVKEGENNPLLGQTFDNFTSGEVPFFGCEDYSFAQAQNGDAIQLGKTMRLQTAVNNGHTFLPLFTDMTTLHTVFGNKVRIGLFTWDDIVARINDSSENPDGSTSAIEGVVINPSLINFILSVDNVKAIEAEKNEPPKVFFGTGPDADIQKTQKEQIADQYKNIPPVKMENRFCNASFILGIISLILDFTPITGLLSLVFGIIGRNKALREKQDGAGKALTGIILGAVGMASRLIFIIFMIMNA